MLGVGEKQKLSPLDVKVGEEHLTVCGILNRNRDVATRCDTR
jgi:hypothetical protein